MSQISLSSHAGALRASLLLSLGLSSLACGGSAVTAAGGDGGSSAQAGAKAQGGTGNLGGTTSTGGRAEGGTGAIGGARAAQTCDNPIFDPTTKLTTCSNGLQHRVQATACTYTNPPPPSAEGGSGGEGGAVEEGAPCTRDADCISLPRGYCSFGGDIQSFCSSGCVTDSDCNGVWPGYCTEGDCRVDADCGENRFCSPKPSGSGCGAPTFHCTTLQDECTTDADCTSDGDVCIADNGRRTCVPGAVCGRPFLVADAARMAAVETRADWLDATLTPNASELTPLERALLAAHWARLGQLEHASIAAFARFNLQLLSLGAPSDLVEACNRALSDETAHARSCFALASAYGDVTVGPAQLDIERCFEDTSLVAIAKLVLREGCLGETVAALEAVAAAELADDCAVKQALERIAHDELNHAELAYRFMRWALSVSTPEMRHELACEAAQQLADFESDARNGERTRTNDRLAAHGLLGSDALRAIHLAAARDVSRPLLAALFHIEQPTEA